MSQRRWVCGYVYVKVKRHFFMDFAGTFLMVFCCFMFWFRMFTFSDSKENIENLCHWIRWEIWHVFWESGIFWELIKSHNCCLPFLGFLQLLCLFVNVLPWILLKVWSFSKPKNASYSEGIAVIMVTEDLQWLFWCWQVFTISPKLSANFQLVIRLFQGLVFLGLVAGISVAVSLTSLSVRDVFASLLALIPTGWGVLSVSSKKVPLQKFWIPISLYIQFSLQRIIKVDV